MTPEEVAARRAVLERICPPELRALSDRMDAAAPAATPPPRCRRTTATGRTCRSRPIQFDSTSPWVVALETCGVHLTVDERARRDGDSALRERLADLAADRPPACWFWPVPAGLDLSAPAAALDAWQAGRCAVCGVTADLVEDHDHETGMVRGLLDRRCNGREGRWTSDGPHVFAYYRRRPAVAVLGVTYRYVSPLWGPDPGYGPPRRPDDPWGKDNAVKGIGL